MYDHRSPQNFKQARLTFSRLMPLAQIRADELKALGKQSSPTPTSYLDAAMMTQICLRKFCGVHLYSVDTTKHYADIEMTGMPVGFPYVFGIPADKPRASAAEAEAWAIDTIAAYVLAHRRGEGHNAPQMNTALFALDDVTFAIPRDIVDTMARQGYWSEKRASAQLERVRQSMGGKATGDGLARLEPRERRQLHFALVSMLLAGTPYYPRRWPAAQ